MIDAVYGGEFLNVTSNKGQIPYMSHNPDPMKGAIAYNSTDQCMQVFDGGNWRTLGGGTAVVNMAPNAIAILKWAEKKMSEEQQLQELAKKNPAINDLVNGMYASIETYKNKIEMINTLCKEEQIGTS